VEGVGGGVCQHGEGLNGGVIDIGMVDGVGFVGGGFGGADGETDEAFLDELKGKVAVGFVAKTDSCVGFIVGGDDAGSVLGIVGDEEPGFGVEERGPLETDAVAAVTGLGLAFEDFGFWIGDDGRPLAHEGVPDGEDFGAAFLPVGGGFNRGAVFEDEKRGPGRGVEFEGGWWGSVRGEERPWVGGEEAR
jgi:hypothetical protein